jgi:hypothetical protein
MRRARRRTSRRDPSPVTPAVQEEEHEEEEHVQQEGEVGEDEDMVMEVIYVMDLFRVCDVIIVSFVIYMVMEVIYVMDCDIWCWMRFICD